LLHFFTVVVEQSTEHAAQRLGPDPIWPKGKSDRLCPGNFICSAPRVNASRMAGCLECILSASGVATAGETPAPCAASRSGPRKWSSKFRSPRKAGGPPPPGMPPPESASDSTSRATPSGNSNAPTTKKPPAQPPDVGLSLPRRQELHCATDSASSGQHCAPSLH
jgi:hypothetical protein